MTMLQELVAFIVGWNLLIEYAIGVASVGRAYTVVVDTIIGRKMIPAFKKCCPMNVPFLSTYFLGVLTPSLYPKAVSSNHQEVYL